MKANQPTRLLGSICVLFTFAISCTEKKYEEKSQSWEKSLLLQDSVLVEYMERLIVMDASKEFDKFLALNPKTDEIVIFNFDGSISSSLTNERDSPKSVKNIFSLTFMEDDILVGGSPLKLAVYDRYGTQKDVLKTPALTPRMSTLLQKQIFLTSDNKILGHFHAYPDSSLSNGLIRPMLGLIDRENESASKPLLTMPSESKYSDGQFHGYVFPVLLYSEDKLFISYSNEPKVYIYKYQGAELHLDGYVDLEISDFIEIHPSPSENTYNFDRNHREMKPGMIWKILVDDEQIYLVYTKGIPEGKFDSEIHDKATKYALESNPMYLMVLDKDFRILQKDIAIPYFINGGFTSVSNDGRFIGRKNPVFSDVEAEHEVFYTFRLVESN